MHTEVRTLAADRRSEGLIRCSGIRSPQPVHTRAPLCCPPAPGVRTLAAVRGTQVLLRAQKPNIKKIWSNGRVPLSFRQPTRPKNTAARPSVHTLHIQKKRWKNPLTEATCALDLSVDRSYVGWWYGRVCVPFWIRVGRHAAT